MSPQTPNQRPDPLGVAIGRSRRDPVRVVGVLACRLLNRSARPSNDSLTFPRQSAGCLVAGFPEGAPGRVAVGRKSCPPGTCPHVPDQA
jgi:hypothetical protein